MSAYNAAMNRRVYGAAASLSDSQRRADGGAVWGSIQGTLSHLLWADQMWMSRLDGWDRPTVELDDSAHFFEGAFDAMTAARIAADERIAHWAERVGQDWLEADVTWFSAATQREQTRPRMLIVTHVFNHQTHHRGQAHALLTRFGTSTGPTDLPFVLG